MVVPRFVTVKVCELVLPTGTFPNAALVGTTDTDVVLAARYAIRRQRNGEGRGETSPLHYDFSGLRACSFRSEAYGHCGARSCAKAQGAVIPLIAK